MKDDYKEYYESDEENLDSKSDAKVILFLIIAVSYTHLTLPTNREV